MINNSMSIDTPVLKNLFIFKNIGYSQGSILVVLMIKEKNEVMSSRATNNEVIIRLY